MSNQKITYIGHILTKNSLKPDPKKTEAIMKLPPLKNKEEIQRLRTLLEKDVEWHWDDEQERSLTVLEKLTTDQRPLCSNTTRPTKT